MHFIGQTLRFNSLMTGIRYIYILYAASNITISRIFNHNSPDVTHVDLFIENIYTYVDAVYTSAGN